jgi:hypothetical protein
VVWERKTGVPYLGEVCLGTIYGFGKGKRGRTVRFTCNDSGDKLWAYRSEVSLYVEDAEVLP